MSDEKEKVTVCRPGQRAKRLRKDTKYLRKFSQQLLSGIRYKEGLSVDELCRRWRISRTTFYDWIGSIPEFKNAFEISKTDYAAWWQELNKKTASGEVKGNAGCIIFALTNIEGINWSNKVDVKNTNEEEVKKITIELLPGRPQTLEHIVEGEIVQDNIVQLISPVPHAK